MSFIAATLQELFKVLFDLFQARLCMFLSVRAQLHSNILPLSLQRQLKFRPLECFDELFFDGVVEDFDHEAVGALDDRRGEVAEWILLSVGFHLDVVEDGRAGTARLDSSQRLLKSLLARLKRHLKITLDRVQILPSKLLINLSFFLRLFLVLAIGRVSATLASFCKISLTK